MDTHAAKSNESCGRPLSFLLDAFKDLFTMYCYVFRRINTDADLVAFEPGTVTAILSPILMVSPIRLVRINIDMLPA